MVWSRTSYICLKTYLLRQLQLVWKQLITMSLSGLVGKDCKIKNSNVLCMLYVCKYKHRAYRGFWTSVNTSSSRWFCRYTSLSASLHISRVTTSAVLGCPFRNLSQSVFISSASLLSMSLAGYNAQMNRAEFFPVRPFWPRCRLLSASNSPQFPLGDYRASGVGQRNSGRRHAPLWEENKTHLSVSLTIAMNATAAEYPVGLPVKRKRFYF